jgi:hypothetical protein
MSKVFEPNADHILAVSTTSAELQTMSATDSQVRIHNGTSGLVHVCWGTTAQTATVSMRPIGAGQTECFTKNNATRLAAIMAAGSGTIYITTGLGA